MEHDNQAKKLDNCITRLEKNISPEKVVFLTKNFMIGLMKGHLLSDWRD